MFRIVYTKSSYSLLSQCGINWIYYLYSARLFIPWVNRLAEYICVYTPCISNTWHITHAEEIHNVSVCVYRTYIDTEICLLWREGHQGGTSSTWRQYRDRCFVPVSHIFHGRWWEIGTNKAGKISSSVVEYWELKLGALISSIPMQRVPFFICFPSDNIRISSWCV